MNPERNMQVNKAFEVYRQASLEKDLAKKELETMTDYYVRYTQELQQKIEEQRLLITTLEARLSSAGNQPPGDMKCEARKRGPSLGKREQAATPPGVHRADRTADSTKNPHLKENMERPPESPIKTLDKRGVLDVFEEIQGRFQQIRFLTRRQKDHLRRFHGGTDRSNDQQFSMPIQCTDDTAERTERPGPSALRASTHGADEASVSGASPPGTSGASPPGASRASASAPQSCGSLASRGAGPEDPDSLTRLSVRFPPPSDCEYDFLNSAPERPPGPPRSPGGEWPALAVVCEELPPPSVSPPPPPRRGRPLWSPVLRELERGALDRESGALDGEPGAGAQGPDKCAFCHAMVPQEHMNGHLYLHFSHKNEAGGERQSGQRGGDEETRRRGDGLSGQRQGDKQTG
ncbi:hypothetical protein NHX12_007370 [Muraenolepis orangiensis]|uniref:Tbk1/Ikki binding domain-containing protein n=1 Tax=Muraenolepis orangiensis TaxID=630683 RepID=A0A9Q0I9L6_9TELE|nr:hypothetical protein NHX12_007370 [Muraenolepis orangiensis]